MNRLDEFVWYHVNGDTAANPLVLTKLSENLKLTYQDKLDLCYFYSVVYSIPSALILLNSRNSIKTSPSKTAEYLEPLLLFQSDRRWIKLRHLLGGSLCFWADNIRENHSNLSKSLTVADSNGNLSLNPVKAIRTIEQFPYFGRFSAYLFAETYEAMFGLEPTVEKDIEYDKGRTFSAGILHVAGLDYLANVTDSKKSLPLPKKRL